MARRTVRKVVRKIVRRIVRMIKHTNLNLLPLCWFIFALGATPSIAMKKTFLGWIILKSTWKEDQKLRRIILKITSM